jgi:hypothetical protein
VCVSAIDATIVRRKVLRPVCGPDHGDVAAGARQVEQPRVLALVHRVVEQAHRHAQAARAGLADDAREREARRQRRQPDGVDGRRPGHQAVYGLVDDGAADVGALQLLLALVVLGRADAVVGRQQQGHRAHVGRRERARRLRRQRAGDEAGPEPPEHRGVDLEEPVAGHGRQVERVGPVEHDRALGLGEGAEADPVREVGVEAAQLAGLDALAGEQQVHADRPADAADRQQQVDELGLGGEQLAELVDDDEEVRHRRQLRPLGPHLAVVADRGGPAGVAELLLTPDDLALDADPGTLGQLGVVGEVVDQSRDVREALEGREGRASLVVDEHHAEVLRGVRQGEPQHERAQQLALARAGGADADAVRAHAELRRLLEVEQHGRAEVVEPDRHPQEVPRRARRPRRRRGQRGDVVDAEQLGDADRAGGVDLVLAAEAEAQRRERAGDGLEELRGRGVDDGPLHAHLAVVLDPRVGDDRLLALDRDAERHVRRLVQAVADRPRRHHGPPAQRQVGVGHGDARGDVAPVVDEDDQP